MDKELKEETFGIVDLPADTTRFQANGTWYNVTDRIATGRMAAYQKMTATYGFGMNTKGFWEMLNQLWQHLQKMEFARCSVLIYNAMEGLTRIQENRVQAFEICSLFINADNEDARHFDEAQAQKKIQDWQEAGINADFFLVLAGRCTIGYSHVYKKLSHTTLEQHLGAVPQP